MTSPGPEADGWDSPPPREPENAIIGWLKAVALGARDTAMDVLDEARKGAHDAYNEGWDRFDKKTRYRRKPKP